jgi:hypothetical protein
MNKNNNFQLQVESSSRYRARGTSFIWTCMPTFQLTFTARQGTWKQTKQNTQDEDKQNQNTICIGHHYM